MMATGTRSNVAVMTVVALSALIFPAVVAGEETVSILGMAWTPKPAPALVVSASGPLSYKETRRDGTVVIDFAQAILAAPLPPVQEAESGLRQAEVAVVDDGGTQVTRLTVEVDPGVVVAISALPAGIEVRLVMPGRASAAEAPAGQLADVLAVADESGVSVLLSGDGPFAGKTFTLDGPPRVVLDLPGVVNRVTRRVHPVGTVGVQRVRVAQFATAPRPIVRIVVDLDQSLPYTFQATAHGGLLRVGSAPGSPPAGEPPAVIAEAPASPVPAVTVAEPPIPLPAPPVPAAIAAEPPAVIAEAPASPVPAVTVAEPPIPLPAEGAPLAEQAEVAVAEAAPQAEPPAMPVQAVSQAAVEPPPAPVVVAQAPPPPPPEPVAQAPIPEPPKPEPPKTQAPKPEPPVTQPAMQAQAPAPEPEPVEIVEEPVPAEPPRAEPIRQPAPTLVAPPMAAAPAPAADSPWTTTAAALAEQAQPPTGISTGIKEVETQERQFTGEPISLELKDADIKDVLRMFAKTTGLNIVVDPDVTGTVTVQLENVPWDQCLDTILKINRLDYIVENNVLRVARIERLKEEKQSLASYRTAEELAKPMRTVTKVLSYARADEIARLLFSQNFLLSARGSVVTDTRTNQLIIRDISDRIEGILNLIDSLDTPNPQVLIEARIVETTRAFAQSLGVVWGFQGSADPEHGTSTGWNFPNTARVRGGVDLATPGFGNADGVGSVISFTFADILDSFNLGFALQAAETDGLVKIISSPKVQAQNNQLAHIQSGLLIPVQTVANQTVTVVYVDATLSLDVTPQITAEGTVVLDIDLKKREPAEGVIIQGAGNVPLSTRDARTKVMVRDGGTTVIGGIYKFNDNTSKSGIPGLNKIPVLGALFRSNQTSKKHEELLIFITPRIVKY
jgi:type IV pilus assembly protein PilQ